MLVDALHAHCVLTVFCSVHIFALQGLCALVRMRFCVCAPGVWQRRTAERGGCQVADVFLDKER